MQIFEFVYATCTLTHRRYWDHRFQFVHHCGNRQTERKKKKRRSKIEFVLPNHYRIKTYQLSSKVFRDLELRLPPFYGSQLTQQQLLHSFNSLMRYHFQVFAAVGDKGRQCDQLKLANYLFENGSSLRWPSESDVCENDRTTRLATSVNWWPH